jgi:hypothetical protein
MVGGACLRPGGLAPNASALAVSPRTPPPWWSRPERLRPGGLAPNASALAVSPRTPPPGRSLVTYFWAEMALAWVKSSR